LKLLHQFDGCDRRLSAEDGIGILAPELSAQSISLSQQLQAREDVTMRWLPRLAPESESDPGLRTDIDRCGSFRAIA
jgi:hypothetical protein